MEHVGPVRKSFHDEIDLLDAQVTRMFALVRESLAAATDTFLAGDRELAGLIAERDAEIDELDLELEDTVERLLLFQQPMASEFHHLVAVLRVVPELERSGDLAQHIATRAARGLGAEMPPAARGVVEELGSRVVAMWAAAADGFADRDPDVAARLDQADQAVNALARRLWDEVVAADLRTELSMELALVARFYERLGDHARHIARRFSPRRRPAPA